jgi:hypothetical protein
VRRGRLRAGEAIAAASGLVLLASLFFDWYGYEQGGGVLPEVTLFGLPADAWQSLGLLAWLLALTALAGLGMAALRIAGSRRRPAIAPSAVVSVLGGIAALAVLLRIVFPPDLIGGGPASGVPLTITVELAAYVGLAAAAGIAYGGYRAMGERGTSFAQVADELSKPRGGSSRGSRRGPAKSASQTRSRSSSG